VSVGSGCASVTGVNSDGVVSLRDAVEKGDVATDERQDHDGMGEPRAW
jgi:hypothetical protein